jgi:hypothetical protein
LRDDAVEVRVRRLVSSLPLALVACEDAALAVMLLLLLLLLLVVPSPSAALRASTCCSIDCQ